MKVIILSASTGGGHMSASNALKSYILDSSKEIDVEVIDTLKYINPLLNKIVVNGYIFLVKKLSWLYEKIYYITNYENIFSSLLQEIEKLFSNKLLRLIKSKEVDIVITTHPFAEEMISILKERKKIDVKHICIMTDYAPHNSWINRNVDHYIVSSEAMKIEMIEKGIEDKKVHAYGIPMDNKFLSNMDKINALTSEGLNTDITTVLLMAGSFGVRNIIEIYREISKIDIEFQIIIIVGNNKRLYKAMKKKVVNSKKKTKLIGFTNEVDKYMKMSDILITKPGGLTVTEALVTNIPMIIFDAIPGQEEENSRFLMENDVAISIGNGISCSESIEALLKNENKILDMKERCKNISKPFVNKNILNLIYKISRCTNS